MTEILKQIKDQRAAAEKSTVTRVLQDFRAAASNNAAAIAFYQQAVGATQYDGKTHDHAEFQNWMKDHADKLKSDAMQNAARLHLSYLLLTIQRAGGMTTKQLEPALLAHIAALTAAGAGDDAILARRDKAKDLKDAGYAQVKGRRSAQKDDKEQLFWEQDLIKQGVSNGIFVQWYGISKLFSNLKDWESSPGNVDGIYRKTLLPYYRENKDSRVIAYWDDKIQKEGQKVASSALTFNIDQFNKVARPQLFWQRALDMDAIGQHNRALGEMLTLVKNYPLHPDLPDWITTLEGLLASTTPVSSGTSKQVVVPPSPAPAASPNN